MEDLHDNAKPRNREDISRLLTEWNDSTGALPKDSGWFGEVLGMMQDSFDAGATQGFANGGYVESATITERQCQGLKPISPVTVVINTPRMWTERWYGSGGAQGYEGWSIVDAHTRELVCYLGRGGLSEAVSQIVRAHNELLQNCGAAVSAAYLQVLLAKSSNDKLQGRLTVDSQDWHSTEATDDRLHDALSRLESTGLICATCNGQGAVGFGENTEPCPSCSRPGNL